MLLLWLSASNWNVATSLAFNVPVFTFVEPFRRFNAEDLIAPAWK